jgi:putative flippase GtrA
MNWRAFFQRRRQFLLYCVIGGAGASLDFLAYTALLQWAGMHYQAANVIGYACGGILSFGLNARFNFRTGDRLLRRFGLFCVAVLLGWSASALLLHLAVDRLALDPLASKLATIVVVVVIQYEFNRRISFKRGGVPCNA